MLKSVDIFIEKYFSFFFSWAFLVLLYFSTLYYGFKFSTLLTNDTHSLEVAVSSLLEEFEDLLNYGASLENVSAFFFYLTLGIFFLGLLFNLCTIFIQVLGILLTLHVLSNSCDFLFMLTEDYRFFFFSESVKDLLINYTNLPVIKHYFHIGVWISICTPIRLWYFIVFWCLVLLWIYENWIKKYLDS